MIKRREHSVPVLRINQRLLRKLLSKAVQQKRFVQSIPKFISVLYHKARRNNSRFRHSFVKKMWNIYERGRTTPQRNIWLIPLAFCSAMHYNVSVRDSNNLLGALAQLVARNVRNVEVRGSTPLCSTKAAQIRTAGVFRQRNVRVGVWEIKFTAVASSNSRFSLV